MSANPATGPRGIFINYRRKDAPGYAQLLHDRLVQRYGPEAVYFDVKEQAGIDWEDRIRERGKQADVFLAVIGPHWLDMLNARSEEARSTGAADLVEREIEWALGDWHGRVIPVLVDDTSMPGEYELPRAIRGLRRANAARLALASIDPDFERLVAAIDGAEITELGPQGEGIAGLPKSVGDTDSPPPRRRRASSVPAPTPDHYLDVVDAMDAGTVVLWLGACVRGGLPDCRLVAAQLAGAFPELEIESSDLAEVAQTIAIRRTATVLRMKLSELINKYSEPIDVHHFLASFPGWRRQLKLDPRYQLIVSTNYDRALERAFELINEPFDYAIYKPAAGQFVHFPWREGTERPETPVDKPSEYMRFPIRDDYELERTVIVKLHGAFSFQEGSYRWSDDDYVVTEDQYIDYLSAQAIGDNLPVQIHDMLVGRSCLFLGHPLREWTARMLLRRLWLGTATKHEFSWAIEHEPDELEKRSWSALGNVDLMNAHPSEYVQQLDSALKDAFGGVAPPGTGV